MANLKEIRSRITSVSSTRQITSAMKMVSAAKLKRAQDAITQMRPYAEKLQELLGNLSASADVAGTDSKYTEAREVERILLVCITSNRGLAGAFNSAVIKATMNRIKQVHADKDVVVLSIGKKASDFFKKTEYHIQGSTLPGNLERLYDDLNFNDVAEVAEKVMKRFVAGQFDKVELIYNQFVNAASQVVQVEDFLPIKPAEKQEEEEEVETEYIFEPNKEFIFKELIPKSLKIQFYKAILDSYAAEHGARMTAMHKATDNATELIDDLKLVYNKARQASITNEILEIVGGAEALNN